MISVGKEDYQILESILKKYPLTIYAYGSRTKKDHKKFSDLDLCIFDETYKKLDIFNLQEDLRESNLPFKVDVAPWSMMTEDFKNLIKDDLILIQANPELISIGRNLLSKVSYIPQQLQSKARSKSGFKIFQQPNCLIVDSSSNSPIFNVIYQQNISENSFETEIKDLTRYYNGRPFSLLFEPNLRTNNISSFLSENGFLKKPEHACMVLQLDGLDLFEVPENITIKNVTSVEELKQFVSILNEYWNDAVACKFFLNDKIIHPEIIEKSPLFISYINQTPVSIGAIQIDGDNNAGIYHIFTLQEYRSQGIATNMMKYLINYCIKNSFRKIYLFSSSDSGYKIYKKLGFKLIGKFEYYEWA